MMMNKNSFLVSILILVPAAVTVFASSSSSCQSGLREDNTNYIYCARQSLLTVPTFLSNVVNVVYDELVLSDNLIASIDQASFGNTLKVKKLYLDQNPIVHIDANAFDYVRNYLEEVYFDKKSSHLVDSNENIDYLDNSLGSISDDLAIFDESVLKKCSNLRVLSLKSYRIARLGARGFVRLSKLEKLELVGLGLSRVDQQAFDGLEMSLVELNLDSNALDSVPSNALGSLKRLRRLTLSQNHIRSLASNAFFKCSSALTHLDLSYNYLTDVDESAFNGPVQNSLRTLLVQNNELKWTHFVLVLFSLHQLVELNVDFNQLSVRTMGELGTSEELGAEAVVSNEHYFDVQLSLVSLSAQGNALTERSLSAFDYLYDYDGPGGHLSSNPYLRRKFKYGKLARLNLARNKLKSIPNGFFANLNMSQVRTLTLDRNPLDNERLSARTFAGLDKSLETLSLNSAALRLWSPQLIEALGQLENLRTLKLNGNDGSSPSSSTSQSIDLNLKKISSLELQNANLRELPAFVAQLESLVDLDVSSNSIAHVDINKLLRPGSSSSRLRHLNLNNNPLECDCRARELKIWLVSTYERDLLELIKWQCAQPERLRGRMLASVPLRELVCEEKIETSYSPLKTTTQKVSIDNLVTFSLDEKIVSLDPSIVVIEPTDETKTTTTTTTIPEINSTSSIRRALIPLTPSAVIDSHHYSMSILSWLFAATSLGILIVLTLILITLYLVCLRNRNDQQQQYDEKQQYVKDYLFGIENNNNNNTNPQAQQSNLFSSLSSSTSSTATTSVYTTKSSSSTRDLVDIFGSEYLFAGMRKPTTPIEQHVYDKPNNSILNKNRKLVEPTRRCGFEPIVDPHVYHEIAYYNNNNNSEDDSFYLNQQKTYPNQAYVISNDNYLLQQPIISYNNQMSRSESTSMGFGGLHQQMNSFNEGLIV